MATNGSTRFAKTALRPWHSRPPAHWYRITLWLVRVCSTASKHAGNTKNIVDEWPYWSKVAVSCLILPFAFPMPYFQGQQREKYQSKIQTKFLANNLRKHWELQQDSGCNKDSTQESWSTNASVPPSLFIVNLTGMNEMVWIGFV